MTASSFKLPRLPIDGFLLSMVIAVVVALWYPDPGASGGPLHMGTVINWGVALMFLLSGAALSTEKLKLGARNWRLHLMVQLCTFVLFPLIGVAVIFATGNRMPHGLMMGFFYLCALPSTVSSSVAMTSMAHGNVTGAVFNATLSSLLGMAITPILMSTMIAYGPGGHAVDGASTSGLGAELPAIAEQLLLPFIAGQLLRRFIGEWIAERKSITQLVDRSVIVLIVYNAFCDSGKAQLWTHYGWGTLLQTLLLTVPLLGIVLTITTFATRKLGFNKEDEIAGVFCGSKKSLAMGAPMAKLLLAADPNMGLIVLPLMVYHPLQLFVCSSIAKRYAARDGSTAISVQTIERAAEVAPPS